MQKFEIDCRIPNYGFKFCDGLSDDQIVLLCHNFKESYEQKINKELELAEISGTFAYHLLTVPFIGFIWFRKARRSQYQNNLPVHSKRCFVFPVSHIFGIQREDPETDSVFFNMLKKIDNNVCWQSTSKTSRKFRRIYCNLYIVAYYHYMFFVEKNDLRRRVWQFRANYNKKKIWRWDYGAKLWGIKPRNGNNFIEKI